MKEDFQKDLLNNKNKIIEKYESIKSKNNSEILKLQNKIKNLEDINSKNNEKINELEKEKLNKETNNINNDLNNILNNYFVNFEQLEEQKKNIEEELKKEKENNQILKEKELFIYTYFTNKFDEKIKEMENSIIHNLANFQNFALNNLLN